MPCPQFSLTTIFATTATVAVLCWAITINPLLALLLSYGGIGAVYVVIGASLAGGKAKSEAERKRIQ